MAKPGYRLALFATALALLVVLLGAYTRLTHAGLGCPDWPGCYGFIGVPQSAEQLAHAEQHYPQAPVEAHKGWNEMVHRYFAGSLGLVIFGLAVQALRRRDEPGQPFKLPLDHRPARQGAHHLARQARGAHPRLKNRNGHPSPLGAGARYAADPSLWCGRWDSNPHCR